MKTVQSEFKFAEEIKREQYKKENKGLANILIGSTIACAAMMISMYSWTFLEVVKQAPVKPSWYASYTTMQQYINKTPKLPLN